MSVTPDQVTAEAVKTLIGFAGLDIAPERLPEVAEQVRATVAMVNDLKSVDIADVALEQEFDPTWTTSEGPS